MACRSVDCKPLARRIEQGVRMLQIKTASTLPQVSAKRRVCRLREEQRAIFDEVRDDGVA